MTAANRTTIDLDIPKTAEERIRRTLQPQALFRWYRPKRASDNDSSCNSFITTGRTILSGSRFRS